MSRGRILAYLLVIILGLIALALGIFSGLSEGRRETGADVPEKMRRKAPGPVNNIKRPAGKKQVMAEKPEAEDPAQAARTEPEKPAEKTESPRHAPDEKETTTPQGRNDPEKEGEAGPRVAIIIDDFGNSLKNVDDFCNMDIPVTFAVLPQLPYSRKISRMAKDSGKEIILHLPLENHAGINPGPGTITTGMTRGEVTETFRKNLETVPGAVGVNNHEGSRATESGELMDILLGLSREEGFFFVDSLTSKSSRGMESARRKGVPAVQRKVFLDNSDDVDYIAGQLEILAQKARKEGFAVGIGHCRRNTFLAMEKQIPAMQEKGIQFVPVSELIH